MYAVEPNKRKARVMARKAQGRKKGNGTLLRRGSIWFARWMVDGKLFTRTTGTANRREAEDKLAEFTAPFRLGDEQRTLETLSARVQGVKAELAAIEDGKPALTLLQAWGAYLASTKRPDTGPDTLRMYECQFSRFVDWMKANRPEVNELRHVTPETAKAFAQDLGRELSANSFNKYMTLFRRLWAVLADEARLTCNPWDKAEIRPRRDAPHSRRELTLEELAAVAGAVEGEMRTLFAVGIYTGLRLGDAARLDWGSVDLVRGVVSLVPRKTAHGGKGKRVSIPIHPALAAVLAETPPRGRRGFVMPDIAAQYEASSANFSKAVQAVFHKCGIETAAKGGGGRGRVEVGFHSLRHTFVSLSANAGTPLAVVQAIVGHSNPAMTRHYFHESAEALQSAVAALPDVTRPALPETAPERTGEAVGGNGERFEAFRAIVDAMTEAELNQAQAYIQTRKDK